MFAYSDPNMGINQSGSRSIHVNFIKSNHWKRSLNQDCMDTSQGRFERPIPKYSILDIHEEQYFRYLLSINREKLMCVKESVNAENIYSPEFQNKLSNVFKRKYMSDPCAD